MAWNPVDLMLAAGYGNDLLDNYFHIPAAATHSRSTTSRGDPQQEHDHRRFRADHEAVEQDAPAGRASSSSDGIGVRRDRGERRDSCARGLGDGDEE